LIHFYKRFTFSRMLLMLPLGILFGLSCGTAALQRELEGSLSAGGAGAPLPVADLVQEFAEMKTDMQKLKSIMQHLEKENSELKSGNIKEFAEMKTDMRQQKLKIQYLEKENSELKSEINAIKATVATFNNMNPQHKEQLVNALKVRSIEDDVLQNKADISDLRSADRNFDVRLTQEVGALDGRLSLAEKRTAVCGYQERLSFTSYATLTFERVYDEVHSGGVLEESGYFTAQITGVYFVTLKTSVELDDGETLNGYLTLSSGHNDDNLEDLFIESSNKAGGGRIVDQASASRYVKMSAGETLHITLETISQVYVLRSMLCVSLYSASG